VSHEGSTWSAEVVDEVTLWVLEAAVGLVRLERGEGLRRLDDAATAATAVTTTNTSSQKEPTDASPS
jgi:hypothetical protein